MPFACSKTNELGEELVGSYLHKAHLYHWLKFNKFKTYDRPVRQRSMSDLYIRDERWFVSLIGQTSNLDGIIAQDNCPADGEL